MDPVPDWRVLANEPFIEVATPMRPVDGARVLDFVTATQVGPGADRALRRWRFTASEPISTYVMAFAAGSWQVIEHENGRRVGSEQRPMRLYLRPTVAAQTDADTLVKENVEALEWLEDYFAMRYPFAKLDMLLAPAFPFGGMEHVGAIFYNESRFVFREPPTPTQRWARAATIYHEVAH